MSVVQAIRDHAWATMVQCRVRGLLGSGLHLGGFRSIQYFYTTGVALSGSTRFWWLAT